MGDDYLGLQTGIGALMGMTLEQWKQVVAKAGISNWPSPSPDYVMAYKPHYIVIQQGKKTFVRRGCGHKDVDRIAAASARATAAVRKDA